MARVPTGRTREYALTGILRPDADPEKLALSTFAALQGGLLLTQTMQSLKPLEAALDGALTTLHAAGTLAVSDR